MRCSSSYGCGTLLLRFIEIKEYLIDTVSGCQYIGLINRGGKKMLGAIFGDIVGSVYERKNTKRENLWQNGTFSLDFIKSTSYKFSSFEFKNCFHEKKSHLYRLRAIVPKVSWSVPHHSVSSPKAMCLPRQWRSPQQVNYIGCFCRIQY